MDEGVKEESQTLRNDLRRLKDELREISADMATTRRSQLEGINFFYLRLLLIEVAQKIDRVVRYLEKENS